MTMRALLVAGGLLVASLGPASADSVTAAVTEWDAKNRTVTLEDKTQFVAIPSKITVPDIKPGDEVTVEFEGDENGVAAVNSVTIIKDIAKKLPLPEKRG